MSIIWDEKSAAIEVLKKGMDTGKIGNGQFTIAMAQLRHGANPRAVVSIHLKDGEESYERLAKGIVTSPADRSGWRVTVSDKTEPVDWKEPPKLTAGGSRVWIAPHTDTYTAPSPWITPPKIADGYTPDPYYHPIPKPSPDPPVQAAPVALPPKPLPEVPEVYVLRRGRKIRDLEE